MASVMEVQKRPAIQSAFAYSPKWEIWVNGLVWQAIFQIINSYSRPEVTSIMDQGSSVMETHVPDDLYVRNVLNLYHLVCRLERPDKDFEKDLVRLNLEKRMETQDAPKWTECMSLFASLIGFLHRTGHLRFKPPRDPAK